jgi:hypothetical protein
VTHAHPGVAVDDGVFSVELDFGLAAFSNGPRWLEIDVRSPAGAGAYTNLSPRQPVTAAPLALHALSAPGGSGFWTPDGSNIYSNNSGRVSIGVTGLPFGQLSVATSTGINAVHAENTTNTAFLDTAFFGLGTDSGGYFEATSSSTSARGVIGVSEEGHGGYFLGKGYFSGRVGIGTSGPAVPLHVQGSDVIMQELSSSHGSGTWLEIQNVSSGGLRWGVVSTGEANGEGPGRLIFRNMSDGVSAITLAPDGNVGIGTTGPSTILHVDSGGDAHLGDGSGYQVIGPVNGANLVMDNNEIMARTDGAASTLYINNEGGDVRIGLNGGSTTVWVPVLAVTGADLAERFPVTPQEAEPVPGTVMEIDPDHPGRLRVSRGAYNRRVAGVVSGAGDVPTGTILGNLPGSEGEPAIALSGRVWVRCDARVAGIETGDMLTTSDHPGHAMAVREFDRAHGAVIGKAMTPLAKGESGMVLVLVNLQ